MSDGFLATALILGSAFLHACWNAVLKSGTDRAALIGILNVAAAIISAPILVLVPLPGPSDWVWISVSVLVHLAYQLSLAKMMGSADYSLVYPVSRGLGPLVVTIIALLVLGEELGILDVLSILILIGGAVLAGFSGAGKLHAPPVSALLWACLVGLLIGIYTAIDGTAVKRMSPLTFILWSNILIMPPMMAFLYRLHGREFSRRLSSHWKRGLVMTIVAYTGYTMALFAFRYGGLAEIAALRETSILFAALVGAFWLKERLTLVRLLGIALVAMGAILLKIV